MSNILTNQAQLVANNTSIREQILSMVRDLPEYVEPVEPTPTQEKTVTPVPEGMEVTPDDGYLLSKVILNGFSEGLNLTSLLGYSNMAIDEVIFSSMSALNSTTFTHSLGVTPKGFMICADGDTDYTSWVVGFSKQATLHYAKDYTGIDSVPITWVNCTASTLTSTAIKLNCASTQYFQKGIKYTLVTFA